MPPLKRVVTLVAALVVVAILFAVVKWLPLRTAQEQRVASDVAAAKLYRAAALTVMNRIAEANGVLRSVDRSVADPRKVAALKKALAQRATGQWPYVLDREGGTIGTYGTNGTDATNGDYEELINPQGGVLTIGAQNLGTATTIETTLDPALQHAARVALANYRGAIVAIDPRSNELLAIVSNGPNLALEGRYEPGSIVKVLTGLNAIDSGIDLKPMFPYHCSGDLLIDGRHFGDWDPYGHGDLPDLDEALAESCNIVFADLGLRLGPDRLRRFMTAVGFDGQTDIGLFKVPLGRFEGNVTDRFETAKLSIGLEHESVTALHLAMLASMLANRGVLTAPRLLRARRSVLGEVSAGPSAQAKARVASLQASERMVQAMTAVVSRPKGTGHRAALEWTSLAMKTGTAGERDRGYNAVIMAFAPAESPRIAFGIIAENAGPAEYAGAKIARDFVDAIRERIIK